MNVKLRIPGEAQPSKAIYKFTVSQSMHSSIPASFLTAITVCSLLASSGTKFIVSGFCSEKLDYFI